MAASKEQGKVRVQDNKMALSADNQILKRVIIESDPGSSMGRFLPVGTTEGNPSQ